MSGPSRDPEIIAGQGGWVFLLYNGDKLFYRSWRPWATEIDAAYRGYCVWRDWFGFRRPEAKIYTAKVENIFAHEFPEQE